jgi:uncharacterized membrane protein
MIKFWLAKELAECLFGVIVVIVCGIFVAITSRGGKR